MDPIRAHRIEIDELQWLLVPVSPAVATKLRDQTGESDLVEAVNRAWVGES